MIWLTLVSCADHIRSAESPDAQRSRDQLPRDTGIDPADLDRDGDGWTPQSGDCDDLDASSNPGAADICDDIDNDCDGVVDDTDGGSVLVWVDEDLDGFGQPMSTVLEDPPLCPLPEGYSIYSSDCDDADAARNPAAADDTCDGVDDNCDGRNDDGHPNADRWFYDVDGDGHAGEMRFGCPGPDASPTFRDCDETRTDVFEGAPEVMGDGIDQDCDGADLPEPDEDGDGHGILTDCDDSSIDIHPDAIEACGNSVDDDCDGTIDQGCDSPAAPPDAEAGCQGCQSLRTAPAALFRR